MHNTDDEEAILAASDPLKAEIFIKSNTQFILKCASKCVRRYVTTGDDEWSVALIAFSEALRTYAPEKGPFHPFAELIIRRRLTDHLRSQYRFSSEIDVEPWVFDGQIDDDSGDAALQAAVVQSTIKYEEPSVKAEIEEVGEILSYYGFSFYDLTACSPKAGRTRKSCAAVIKCLISTPALLTEVRRTGTLPVKTLCRNTGVSSKILERHRKYIIASTEILCGDFPGLAQYLSYVRDV